MNRATPESTAGASTEQMIKARVKITGVDHKHSRVSFVGPAKIERNVTTPYADLYKTEHNKSRHQHSAEIGHFDRFCLNKRDSSAKRIAENA
jgi:hypothetical protein